MVSTSRILKIEGSCRACCGAVREGRADICRHDLKQHGHSCWIGLAARPERLIRADEARDEGSAPDAERVDEGKRERRQPAVAYDDAGKEEVGERDGQGAGDRSEYGRQR